MRNTASLPAGLSRPGSIPDRGTGGLPDGAHTISQRSFELLKGAVEPE